jgi:di/tricarboxylate transporter
MIAEVVVTVHYFVARVAVASIITHQRGATQVTLQQALSLSLLGLLLVLFVWDRYRFDIVALLALLAAVACGIVPMHKAFSGFSNPLLPLIASALIVSNAVGKSGVIDAFVRYLRPVMRSPGLQVSVLSGTVAVLSALVKNIGALAIFLPVAMQVARRNKRSVSEFLMPMSFASLVGGMMTLIGTSPNLIASSVRQELVGKPYAMFDFLPVGFGITVIGIIFLSVGWRLVPVRNKGQDTADMPFRIEDYISETRLPEKSPLVGKTVADLEALGEGAVSVVSIIREGNRRYTPSRHWQLFADDILVLESDPHDLHALVESASLALIGPKQEETGEKKPAAETIATEAVITAGSPMIGLSSAQIRLRERYGISLLAVSRGGRRSTARLGRMNFREGDVVVFQGVDEDMNDALASLGALPLAQRNLQLGKPRKAVLTVLILLAAIGVSAADLVPPEIAFTAGAVLIVLLRISSATEIYRAVDWPILILLGALIPIGEGMRATGTTDLIAGWLKPASAVMPVPVTLGMILVITMLLTPLVHHAAAVLVMGPVAASLAGGLGLQIDPFLMAVAVGASCDFLSPIGHQCNTLVMGPGGYRFSDYWHLGLPLSALVAICGVPLILMVWPLHP